MGVLANIDDTLMQTDSTIGLMSELSLLPNSLNNWRSSLFKCTYLDAKDIWLYEYRFECPNILKKLNDIVSSHDINASKCCTKFNGFNITIAVCCNSINRNSLRNHARVTYTLEITNENGYKMIIDQHESTYAPRASVEMFADSLFRLKLGTLSNIFKDVDSIYDYLSCNDLFRGYKLV